MTDLQSKTRWTLENLLMCIGKRYTSNQRTILKRIQKRNDWLSFLMMNQTTPHLWVESSLINNESSNLRMQPRMGTAFIAEWMASTWMSQCIERIKKALECKQTHPMTMEHQRGGTYISNQVRMHACHLTSNHCTHIF